jgi:ubiquinone/menaquinone biosynthesis C-methylase UbiE
MTMSTDYDAIAERYKRAKQQPWRSLVESFTLMELLGDLTGLSVVDLACGEGFYTRRIRERGAARVVGVDLSAGMIELARKAENANPLGIEYVVGDGRALALDGEFDLAAAAYLLNYAQTAAELEAMCRGIARCLKPGGRFVTVNSNPDLDFNNLPSFRAYGFEVEGPALVEEGTPYTWVFHLDDGPLRVDNYHIDGAAHERALRAAGFGDVRWHKPRLDPAGNAGQCDWTAMLEYAPVIFLECRKWS